jgi:glucose/arabinose dehydrogenase
MLTFLYVAAAILAADAPPVERLRVPQGFRIALYAHPVPDARSLALGARGTVFVGTRKRDVVYALRDDDRDGRAESIRTFASGLDTPNGVAFKDGALYVAELSRVLRFDDAESNLEQPRQPAVVSDAFPQDKHHGWKFIAFGPDGRLYVPVGAPCNICERADPRYASILRLPDGGGQPEVVAHGVRNTVGFDWHPETKQLWFTDNGRDMLGDDTPPDELNRAARSGLHFGYPFCHATSPDPDFGKGRSCAEFEAPVQELGPHVAAIGMRFYTGAMFPVQYRNQILIAEHGSWNRSRKIGYRLSLVRLSGERAVAYETFAEGWLQGEEAWGRPVDVLLLPDGSLLVSDDTAGALYRITYDPSSSGARPTR